MAKLAKMKKKRTPKYPATKLMTVAQIQDALDAAGIGADRFWRYAMGGDMANLPRGVVRQMISQILRNKDRAK